VSRSITTNSWRNRPVLQTISRLSSHSWPEAAVDYTSTLNAYDLGNKTSVANTIKGYNTACVQTGQSAYNDFAQKVSNLENTEVNEKTWAETIDDAAAAAKAAATTAIDVAAKNAKNYIGQLPEGTRNSAARLFVAGTKVVLNFFATVWDKIKVVLDSIGQFVKGVWNNLTSSVSALKAAADLAIKYITGAGGYQSVALADVDLLILRANPRKYNVVPTRDQFAIQ